MSQDTGMVRRDLKYGLMFAARVISFDTTGLFKHPYVIVRLSDWTFPKHLLRDSSGKMVKVGICIPTSISVPTSMPMQVYQLGCGVAFYWSFLLASKSNPSQCTTYSMHVCIGGYMRPLPFPPGWARALWKKTSVFLVTRRSNWCINLRY